MFSLQVLTVLILVTLGSATPAFWKGTSLDSTVEEMRALCAEDDPIACLKYKAISFLDSLLHKDNFKIGDDVQVSRNSYHNEISSRNLENPIEDNVEEFIKSHDATFKLPILETQVTLGARNLDQDELDFKVNFAGEARKSKIKKILVPILVFVLLKAITLVPLALGVLGLKAWNALQLSFFSFIVSVGLAIFQLCKKIAVEHAAPQISAHPPWDPHHYAARSLDAQILAYQGQI